MSWTNRTASAKWVVPEQPDPALVADLAATTELPLPAVRILCNRGFIKADDISRFLDPKLTDLRDPFEMVGMKAAIERITAAFFDNEKMVIYGDYDVDGITATSLLYMVLNKLGGQVSYYLPNRLVEGYGLSEKGINGPETRA
jgi:single-stranded-DNA-specific exonuclease